MIAEGEKSHDQVQSKSEVQGFRRTGGISFSLSPSLKAGEDQCPWSNIGRERKQIVYASAFSILFMPLVSYIIPIHIGKGN